MIAFGGPGRLGVEPGGRSEIDEDDPLLEGRIVEGRTADDHIRIAVAVHIPRGPQRAPEVALVLIALGGPGRIRQESGRRPVIDVRSTLVDLTVVVEIGADD